MNESNTFDPAACTRPPRRTPGSRGGIPLWGVRSLAGLLGALLVSAAWAGSASAQEEFPGGGAASCEDGFDNDGDDYVDFFDPDCGVLRDTFFTCTVPAASAAAFDLNLELETMDTNIEARMSQISVDVDNDGVIEIITPRGGDIPANNQILIIDATTGVTEATINAGPTTYFGRFFPGIAAGQLDGGGHLEIVWLSGQNRRTTTTAMQQWFLNVARFSGGTWTITQSADLVTIIPNINSAIRGDTQGWAPSLADIDEDGVPEIVASRLIFRYTGGATPSVDLLADCGTAVGATAWGNVSDVQRAPGFTVPMDILASDPGLEIAAGNQVYTIDTSGATWSCSVVQHSNSARPDGYTSVGDMNLDGQLDIVVAARTEIYIWDPVTRNDLARWTFTDRQVGRAVIGEFWDDGAGPNIPEVTIVSALNSGAEQFLRAYSLRNTSAPLWSLPVIDPSGSTKMAIYDLDGDGTQELIYRDENNVRIMYGGPAPFPAGVDAERNYSLTPCTSNTRLEGPILSDSDQDGEVEIVVACSLGLTTFGPVRVYGSLPGTVWTPSRSVWNQYYYHITNVYENGRIPAEQQAINLQIPPAPATPILYPLNGAMTQIDEELLAVRPGELRAIDVSATVVRAVPDASCANINVTLNITNTGDATTITSVPISYYDGNPAAGGTLLFTDVLGVAIPPGGSGMVTHSIPAPGGGITLYAVVNDDGTMPTSAPTTLQAECDITDNVAMISVAGCCADDTVGGTDTGCGGGTPACDTSGATPICVVCTVDPDCPSGSACDLATHTCMSTAACMDTVPIGQDSGCTMARPVCDEMAAGGAACVRCQDITTSGTDDGCVVATPVCDESRGPDCVICLQDGMGPGGIDQGCLIGRPHCVLDGTGFPIGCRECIINAHCSGTTPVCNTSTNTCTTCLDTAPGGGLDSGCVTATPVCDTSGAAPRCVECLLDSHCPASEPRCDTSGATPMCVECLVDADCGGAASCDLATHTCMPTGACVNDRTTGRDTGCTPALPVCDEMAPGGPTCVRCQDTGSRGTDDGCDTVTPICLPTGGPGGTAICVQCSVDRDCTNPSFPACDVDTHTCEVCVDVVAGGGIDRGCNMTDPICEEMPASGSRRCLHCVNDGNGIDSGCTVAMQNCVVGPTGTPICVQCEDSTAGGVDRGCTSATPACNTSGTFPVCVLCEDNTVGGTDNGCITDRPHCTGSGATLRCVECLVTADCTGDLVCSPTNTCVPGGCTSNADCVSTPETPVCNTDTGICVECLDNPDCTVAEPICDMTTSTCVECLEDAHCPGEQACDPEMHTCIQCMTDADCTDPELPHCNTVESVCVECLRTEHCDAGEICDRTDYTCGPECRSDQDCRMLDPTEPVCDRGTCVECLYNRDCSLNEVCDVPHRVCRPQCSSDADCTSPSLPGCDVAAGVCVPCTMDSHCGAAEACDVDSHTCGPECETDDQCEGTPESPNCDNSDGVCLPCVDGADCPTGICDMSTAQCVECIINADCSGGLVCHPTDRVCVGCNNDADCGVGGHCDPTDHSCTPTCADSTDCPNPRVDVCDDGECVECVRDLHCDDGEICWIPEGNICQPRCTRDDECGPEAPICDTGSGACVECIDRNDCRGSEVCDPDTHTCEMGCGEDADCTEPDRPACETTSGMCVQCTGASPDYCVEGTICDERVNRCTVCTEDDVSACADSPDGVACILGGTVESNRCGCTETGDCPRGAVCDTDTQFCSDAPPLGGPAGGALCAASTPGSTGAGRGALAAGFLLLLGLGIFFLRRRR